MARTRASLGTLLLGSLLAVPAARPGEIPTAVVILEVPPRTPGSDATGAPPRIILLKDGQVFVGGTGGLAAGRLEKGEAQTLKRSAEAVRKAAGKAARLGFGGDTTRTMRLRLPEDDQAEVAIAGDPAVTAVDLAVAARALEQLLRFDHPSLRPYKPASYALSAREDRLVGGCRAWRLAFPIAEAVALPQVVSAADAQGWPSGAWPASVCVGEKHYVVTLRPLLPGELP
jgi:hypothetical protein